MKILDFDKAETEMLDKIFEEHKPGITGLVRTSSKYADMVFTKVKKLEIISLGVSMMVGGNKVNLLSFTRMDNPLATCGITSYDNGIDIVSASKGDMPFNRQIFILTTEIESIMFGITNETMVFNINMRNGSLYTLVAKLK